MLLAGRRLWWCCCQFLVLVPKALRGLTMSFEHSAESGPCLRSGLGVIRVHRLARRTPKEDVAAAATSWRVPSAKAIPTKYCRSIPTTRAVGDAVADRASGSGGIAGLFRDRLQGSPRPQGCVRRSADPFVRRYRGKYRLSRTERPGFSRRATASLMSSAATIGSLWTIIRPRCRRPRDSSSGLAPLL